MIFAIFENSQKTAYSSYHPNSLAGIATFVQKWPIFNFSKKQKINFELLYKYKIVVPIPTKQRK